MIIVRCKECNTELTSSNKIQTCGCPNQLKVEGNKISAENLDRVVMVSQDREEKIDSVFSREELAYQEQRRKRKVKRLDFEVR